MSDGRRPARGRAAPTPPPPTRAQLETLVESLTAKQYALNEDKIELATTLAQREAQLKDLSDIAAKYESTQEENKGLNGTIARLDQLLLQREAEEEGIIFPDGDRAKWFKSIGNLLTRKDQLVKSIEDVLIDDAKVRGLDVSMDRVTVMMMLGREVAAGSGGGGQVPPRAATAPQMATGSGWGSQVPPRAATAPPAATRALGLPADIRRILFGVRETANTASIGQAGPGPVATGASSGPVATGASSGPVATGASSGPVAAGASSGPVAAGAPSGPVAAGAPSGPGDTGEPCAAERRRIQSLLFRVDELEGEIRVMRVAQSDIEDENVVLRNLYVDLRQDQTDAYAQILQLTGQPWKQDPPGGLPGSEHFVRTVGAIERIQRNRTAAEAARRAREAAYAAMSDTEKQQYDRRQLIERRRQVDIDLLAKTRLRVKVARAMVQSGAPPGGGDGAQGGGDGAQGGGGDGAQAGGDGAQAGGDGAQGGGDGAQERALQAELRLVEAQQRVVEMGNELQRQQQDCDDEKRRMLGDHDEDKNQLRDQNRRDHERCEREKQVLRQRIERMVTQIDRLTVTARLYERQTAGSGQATSRDPHLEDVHLQLERALRENAALRGRVQRLELRVSLAEGNVSADDVATYQALASGVEQMQQLMSCDEVRTELNESRDLLERSLFTQQSLGQAMRSLMDYVLSVGAPGADGALRPPAAALQAVSRMQSDFQDYESRWAGAERGGTSNSMLRRKLRKTVARAASLRVEEIEDLAAENDSLRAQLAEYSNIVDLQRWRTVNTEIETIESEILGNGPHPLTPPRDLLRLARLQTERLRMMPCPELRQFAISLQKEAIPAIHDLSDDYFFREWNDLYDNVRAWCTRYYSFQEHSRVLDYDTMVHEVLLLGFYVRDVLIHRDYVPQFLNNLNGTLPTGRADVATAIVFRILVEEIFEPVRFMIGLRFTDATQRWKIKKQYKIAFEVRDMGANGFQPRFQNKESFLERKRKQSEYGYPHPEINEDGPPPKKRVKSSLQKFNFIRTFEDDEPAGTTRDNDGKHPPPVYKIFAELKSLDDIIMNTSRAKFMRTIFSLSTDPTNPQFKELRSNVSNVIIDTLDPLGRTRIPAVPARDAVAAIPEVNGATWRADPRLHKASLWSIIKRAYDLAITMRCQRTNIHPLIHDLTSMMSFDNNQFTIVNYPEAIPPVERAAMDSWLAHSSPGPENIGCSGRPVCEVLPALLRRGDPELGNYSWRDRVVISKSKVYVGGLCSFMLLSYVTRGFC